MNVAARVRNYYQRRAASLVCRRSLVIRPSEPVVSFTFDDFPRSALMRGGAILADFGVSGTYYASLGLAGLCTATGRMFEVDDLDILFRQGHELGCHTYWHSHSWNSPTEAFEQSIDQNRRALRSLYLDRDFEVFSYPVSPPRPATKLAVGNRFLCSRAGGQRSNVGSVDLNQLSAFFIEKVGGRREAIQKLIDHNARMRGWLILATHDVAIRPTRFGCTPELLRHVVLAAVQSGAVILPVAAALRFLQRPVRLQGTTLTPEGGRGGDTGGP